MLYSWKQIQISHFKIWKNFNWQFYAILLYIIVHLDPVRSRSDVPQISWGRCLWRIQEEEAGVDEDCSDLEQFWYLWKMSWVERTSNWSEESLGGQKGSAPIKQAQHSSSTPTTLVTGWEQPSVVWLLPPHTSEGATAGSSQSTMLLKEVFLKGNLRGTIPWLPQLCSKSLLYLIL